MAILSEQGSVPKDQVGYIVFLFNLFETYRTYTILYRNHINIKHHTILCSRCQLITLRSIKKLMYYLLSFKQTSLYDQSVINL